MGIRLRSAMLGARAVLQFAAADVVAIVAVTAALFPLALRGGPARVRRKALEAEAGERRRTAVGESPFGSP